MEYCTVKEIGEKWDIPSRMVNVYCANHRIPDVIKKVIFGLSPQMQKSRLI